MRYVHRCGASGSMRACHAEGPGSIPNRDRFPGWGFFSGFFLTCKTNVRKLVAKKGPRISSGRHNHHFIVASLDWVCVFRVHRLSCLCCLGVGPGIELLRWYLIRGSPPCPCAVKKVCDPPTGRGSVRPGRRESRKGTYKGEVKLR